MLKELCECGKVATWCYMPGYLSGESPFSCDDCVPRGCECVYHYCDVNAYHPPFERPFLPEGVENVDWKWIDEGHVWAKIDENGRVEPCAEYGYDPKGWDREINPHTDETYEE